MCACTIKQNISSISQTNLAKEHTVFLHVLKFPNQLNLTQIIKSTCLLLTTTIIFITGVCSNFKYITGSNCSY